MRGSGAGGAVTYVPAEQRYEAMPYRRCGRSGLQLPAISLGLWNNFGDDRPMAGIVAIVVLAKSPLSRAHGDASEAEMRAIARGADVDKQFKRPPNEGGLL